jgi:hypothetical protein
MRADVQRDECPPVLRSFDRKGTSFRYLWPKRLFHLANGTTVRDYIDYMPWS